jgi:Rv0078B-related antitoxin
MPPRAESLRQAFDLFTTGVEIMRQNLRRAMPHASPDDIERRLTAWLHTRPGAETGDASGRAGSLDRFVR